MVSFGVMQRSFCEHHPFFLKHAHCRCVQQSDKWQQLFFFSILPLKEWLCHQSTDFWVHTSLINGEKFCFFVFHPAVEGIMVLSVKQICVYAMAGWTWRWKSQRPNCPSCMESWELREWPHGARSTQQRFSHASRLNWLRSLSQRNRNQFLFPQRNPVFIYSEKMRLKFLSSPPPPPPPPPPPRISSKFLSSLNFVFKKQMCW